MPFSKLIVVLPSHGLEDFPIHLNGSQAESILANWTTLWHPALIASTAQMPTWESVDFPSQQYDAALVLVPSVVQKRLGEPLEAARESKSATIISGLTRRGEILAHRLIAKHLAESNATDEIIRDFFALGYAFLQIQLMTRQLRYSSSIDMDEFAQRITRAAAHANGGDDPTVDEGIQSCFDLLLEEKTRYYPVQPQLLDLVLLAPTTLGPGLQRQLENSHLQNFLASGDVIQRLKTSHRQSFERLKTKSSNGDADFMGGLQLELRTPMYSIESTLRQLRQGIQTCQESFHQRPTMFARHSFGLSPQIPGLLQQLDFGGAFHVSMQNGRIPASSSPTINWEGMDGTTIPALTAPPIDAGKADGFVTLGVTIGQSLDSAHFANVVLAHWPDRTSDYFGDLQRTQKYGSLFGRFVSAGDYLDSIYDPGYSESYAADEYRNEYLVEDVKAEKPFPISVYIEYWQSHFLGSSVRNLMTLLSIWQLIDVETATRNLAAVEGTLLEIDRQTYDRDPAALQQSQVQLDNIASELIESAGLSPGSSESSTEHPGDALLINPLSCAQRFNLQPNPDLLARESSRSIQNTDRALFHGRWIADLPAFGSIHISSEADLPKSDPPILDGLTLCNEYFELLIDEKTGGIGRVKRPTRRSNILTQKLACRTSQRADVKGYPINRGRYTEMIADDIQTDEATRGRARITSTGRLVEMPAADSGTNGDRSGGITLAQFRQTVSVTRGVRIIEIQVEIQPQIELSRDAWQSYICSRIAWADEFAEIFRNENETRQRVIEDRFCAPCFVDIVDDLGKLTLLPRGMAYHKRSSRKTLDTLMMVAGETRTHFCFGIAIDIPISIAAATAYQTPCFLASIAGENQACRGWIFHLSCKNITATYTAPRFNESGGVSGATLRLQETEGCGGTLRIACPRNLTSASRVNFLNEHQGDLATEDSTVICNFIPFQYFQIELYW